MDGEYQTGLPLGVVQRDEVVAALLALRPRLHRAALRLGCRPDQAEDLVQATCLRALERAGQYRGDGPIAAWVFTILVSIDRNQRRAARTAARAQTLMPPMPLSEDGRRVVEARLRLAEVLRALESLSPTLRTTLERVALDGLTYADAADRLNVPIGTIMSRLARARQVLTSVS